MNAVPGKGSRIIAGAASCLLLCFFRCAGWPGPGTGALSSSDIHEKNRNVYVVSNGFHTGIILDTKTAAFSLLAFGNSFKEYRYVDIGWGDEAFYQEPRFDFWSGARALLVPTDSVVRVEGFNADIPDVAAWSDRTVAVPVTENESQMLCQFINLSLRKDTAGNPVVVSERGGGSIVFYKSPRKYHLFNTCNTWIADAFAHAGLPVSAACVVTANNLFTRLERIGSAVR